MQNDPARQSDEDVSTLNEKSCYPSSSMEGGGRHEGRSPFKCLCKAIMRSFPYILKTLFLVYFFKLFRRMLKNWPIMEPDRKYVYPNDYSNRKLSEMTTGELEAYERGKAKYEEAMEEYRKRVQDGTAGNFFVACFYGLCALVSAVPTICVTGIVVGMCRPDLVEEFRSNLMEIRENQNKNQNDESSDPKRSNSAIVSPEGSPGSKIEAEGSKPENR